MVTAQHGLKSISRDERKCWQGLLFIYCWSPASISKNTKVIPAELYFSLVSGMKADLAWKV